MRTLALCFLAVTAAAQPAARFEVASIRPSQPDLNRVSVGFRMDRQQAHFTAIPLASYISSAYGVKASQIIGPAHLQDRFDISATVPEGLEDDKLPEMLRGLLEDRFQLKSHPESREMLVYVITVNGQTKLEEAGAASADPEAGFVGGGTGGRDGISLDLGGGSSFTFANNQWVGKKLTFQQVAEQLEQFLDHPVADRTGLAGRYNLTLAVTTDDYVTMRVVGSAKAGFPVPPQFAPRLEAPNFDSLFAAFEKLGLQLETRKLPQPVVVIDSILKAPTEN